jgi:hypothetical protein
MALDPISLRGPDILRPAKMKALDGVELVNHFSQSEGRVDQSYNVEGPV